MDASAPDYCYRGQLLKVLRIVALTLLSLLCIGTVVYLTLVLMQSRQAALARYPNYGQLAAFDPEREGGHLLPNLDMLVRSERAGRGVRFITNSKGFRNSREFDYQTPPNTTRVLFLGDSFVDGMGTDQEHTIGYLLEEFLNKQSGENKHFEVLISGHNNPVNAWYYFQEHGYKYQPELVILGVTLGNDLSWHSYKVGFVPARDERDQLLLIKGSQSRQTGREQVDLLLPPDAYTRKRWLEAVWDLELSVRYFLAQKFYVFSQLAPPWLAPRESARRRVYAGGFSASLALFYQPLMQEARRMYRDFEEVVSGFNALTQRKDAQLLIVIFPTRMQVSGYDWNLLIKAYSLDSSRFDLEYPNKRIRSYCLRHGIKCIDVLDELKVRESRGDGGFYRSRGDMHFNEKGQRTVAEILSRQLSE